MAAAWLLGESVGSRRAYVDEIEEKANRLEREREAEADAPRRRNRRGSRGSSTT